MGIGVLDLGLVVLVLNSFLSSPTPILIAGFRLVLDLFVTLTNFVRSDKETILSSADLAEPLLGFRWFREMMQQFCLFLVFSRLVSFDSLKFLTL